VLTTNNVNAQAKIDSISEIKSPCFETLTKSKSKEIQDPANEEVPIGNELKKTLPIVE